jgi:hypothetical protein
MSIARSGDMLGRRNDSNYRRIAMCPPAYIDGHVAGRNLEGGGGRFG